MRALYEPLHEQLARLTPGDIGRLRPGSWASNHSDTPPYFQEYETLLRPGRRGVPHYRPHFAYERFFLDPDEENAELEAYLRSLLAGGDAGQISVLKFCRSLGRTAWLQRRFPAALHAVVIRDPVAQWASARQLLKVQRNRYFATAPLLVLARNAAHPLVRAAVDALDVRLPELHSPDVAYGIEACWRHIRRTTAEEHYRGFLALWAACCIRSLGGGALVIDAKRTAVDPPYRQATEAALTAKLGQAIDLRSRPATEPVRADWLTTTNQAAYDFVRVHGHALPSDRLDLVLGYLGSSTQPRPRSRKGSCVTMRPPEPRTRLQRAITSAAVLVAQAIQPIRRLHGALIRPRNQIT